MKTTKSILFVLLSFIFTTGMKSQTAIPGWCADKAKQNVESLSKEITLTPEQMQLLIEFRTQLEADNYLNTKDLTLNEDKTPVYTENYWTFTKRVKAKFTPELAKSILNWKPSATKKESAVTTVSVPQDTPQDQIPDWCLDKATKKATEMCADIKLTDEQKKLFIYVRSQLDNDNYVKCKGITSEDDKKDIFQKNYMTYMKRVKDKFAPKLAESILNWER